MMVEASSVSHRTAGSFFPYEVNAIFALRAPYRFVSFSPNVQVVSGVGTAGARVGW